LSPNLLPLILFLIGSTIVIPIRMKWMSRIAERSEPAIDAIAGRITVDLVILSIIVWKYVRLPEHLYGLWLQVIFVAAIVLVHQTIFRVLRRKNRAPHNTVTDPQIGSKRI
jgi:hypothetical protein